MSHELKTPMNAIVGFTDLLKSKETDDKKLKKLEIIKDSSNTLMQIIDDILDFSKIENGNISIEKSLFETIEPFESVTKLFQARASQRDISLEISYDENLPTLANGDNTRIKQVYANLLSNAIKFSPKKSKVLININSKNKNTLVCKVQDFGIGIAKENIDKIFKVFEQVDESATRNYEGTGLGLSISLELAKLMNGNLHVESELNNGSTFYFEVELFKDIDKEL